MMNSDMENAPRSKRARILPSPAPATQRRSGRAPLLGPDRALTEPHAAGVHAEQFFGAGLEAERGQELLQSIAWRGLARPGDELARFFEAPRRREAIHS